MSESAIYCQYQGKQGGHCNCSAGCKCSTGSTGVGKKKAMLSACICIRKMGKSPFTNPKEISWQAGYSGCLTSYPTTGISHTFRNAPGNAPWGLSLVEMFATGCGSVLGNGHIKPRWQNLFSCIQSSPPLVVSDQLPGLSFSSPPVGMLGCVFRPRGNAVGLPVLETTCPRMHCCSCSPPDNCLSSSCQWGSREGSRGSLCEHRSHTVQCQ